MRRNVRLFALLTGVTAMLSACTPGESGTSSSSSGVALTATAFGSALARGVSATLTAGSTPASMTTTVALSPVVMVTRPPTVAPTPMSLIAPSPVVTPTLSGSAAAAATRTAAPAGTGRIVTVTADASVNMRGMPSTMGDVLGFIPPGEDAAVVEENVMSPDGGTTWLKVTYAGITGFVRSDLVDMARAGTPRAGSAMATAPSSGTAAAGTTAASPAAGAVATPTRLPVTPTR